MSEKRFTLSEKGIVDNVMKKEYNKISSNDNPVEAFSCGDLLTLVHWLNESEKQLNVLKILNKTLRRENEQLRMKLKGDDYIMVSEMLSNLRKTGICDGCKNKDKPVEWYLERGFSITGRVCDRYEPEV